MNEALSSWEERVLAAVDKAEASLARGEGRSVATPEEAKQLVEDIRRRGIARLNAENDPRA